MIIHLNQWLVFLSLKSSHSFLQLSWVWQQRASLGYYHDTPALEQWSCYEVCWIIQHCLFQKVSWKINECTCRKPCGMLRLCFCVWTNSIWYGVWLCVRGFGCLMFDSLKAMMVSCAICWPTQTVWYCHLSSVWTCCALTFLAVFQFSRTGDRTCSSVKICLTR